MANCSFSPLDEASIVSRRQPSEINFIHSFFSLTAVFFNDLSIDIQVLFAYNVTAVYNQTQLFMKTDLFFTS